MCFFCVHSLTVDALHFVTTCRGGSVAVSEVELYQSTGLPPLPTPLPAPLPAPLSTPLSTGLPPLSTPLSRQISNSNTDAAPTNTDAAAPPQPHLPPALSRRAAALAPSTFNLSVSNGGGALIGVNGLEFDLSSSFSEVGPYGDLLSLAAPL